MNDAQKNSHTIHRTPADVNEPGTRRVVLHTAWVASASASNGQMVFWAEAASSFVPRRPRFATLADPMRPRPHPFAASHQEVTDALACLSSASLANARPVRIALWLPAQGQHPCPSPELTELQRTPANDTIQPMMPTLALWRVPAFVLDAEAATVFLAGLPQAQEPLREENGLHHISGDDTRYWSGAARFAMSLLVRQRYLPSARELPELPQAYDVSHGASQLRVASDWLPYLDDEADRTRFNALVTAMPEVCRAIVPGDTHDADPANVPSAQLLLADYLQSALNACIQRWLNLEQLNLRPSINNRLTTGARPNNSTRTPTSHFANYYGSLLSRWLGGLMTPNHPLYTTPAEAAMLLDSIARWHARLTHQERPPFRLCLRLSPPPAPEPAESEEVSASTEPTETNSVVSLLEDTGIWRLDYLLQARDDLSLLVPLTIFWNQADIPNSFLDRRFEHPHERILSILGQAARFFPPIERSLSTAEPIGCDLTGREAYQFLHAAMPLIEELDCGVLTPSWWQHPPSKPALRLQLHPSKQNSGGLLGIGTVFAYDWQLALNGVELSRAELAYLAALKEPVVRLRGQWIHLASEQVEQALRFASARSTTRMSLGEALQTSLTGELVSNEFAVEEVQADGWIGDLLTRLQHGTAMTELAPPAELQGTLRPYQQQGLNWLSFLAEYGLGACLADDMGLGKTVQLLSFLLHQQSIGALTKPVLLVCPTSVVGNWQHETARFAPSLRLLVHHGAGRVGRIDVPTFAAEIANYDLVVTTYSLLARDEEALGSVEWQAIVLDEAQNIKNVEARQSRSLRKLHAPMRIALTGTPVENRLAELWSIMDFLNPGYLGSQKRFQERFAYPIEKLHDQPATERLQALIQPFVLRRLKTDETIIQDLPEKLEMCEYCPLTKEQVSLYESVVRSGLRDIEEAGDMQRRGIILSMLSKLKQICNHPAHFLGDGSALPGRSGKLTRLEELIEELLSEGDHALIFTQFTALGDRLHPYLQERFGVETLYLHGSLPRAQRERMVARFQEPGGPPLFLLSLKAGGVGLNLTRANHVIHFDRWWNPAVENQATDRAFRIGQRRNVQVRKLVSMGTLEERIDSLIAQKRLLAEQVVGTGEGWITEMSTMQLRDLFTLRADALID